MFTFEITDLALFQKWEGAVHPNLPSTFLYALMSGKRWEDCGFSLIAVDNALVPKGGVLHGWPKTQEEIERDEMLMAFGDTMEDD